MDGPPGILANVQKHAKQWSEMVHILGVFEPIREPAPDRLLSLEGKTAGEIQREFVRAQTRRSCAPSTEDGGPGWNGVHVLPPVENGPENK